MLWHFCLHFPYDQSCLSWSFSMAQSLPEELQLCYFLLHWYTWQILAPCWVNIPGFTSVLISAKSELLRNEEDERPAQSALTICLGFDGSWWKFSVCTPIAFLVLMIVVLIHRGLCGSSLAGCDSSEKCSRKDMAVEQEDELL